LLIYQAVLLIYQAVLLIYQAGPRLMLDLVQLLADLA
jgi:hypothetical protein